MYDALTQTYDHLPVSTIAKSVAEHFKNQLIPIVTSEVASGKTLLIPAWCAAALWDDPVDNVIYVLEPTRFLSNNAAETLRKVMGPGAENLVGCINSNRSDDESITHSDNRIIFTTVGYALASGILKTKSNFILDEAHETSIDLSLTKAYLHHRRAKGDLINIAELSATIDVANELEYWGDDAVHFTTKGSAHPIEYLHRPAFSLEEAVSTLIEEYDRKGILVFVSGVEEIEEAITAIGARLTAKNLDFEIVGVHGNSPGDQRRLATRDRKKAIKILVGTNVLESGVNLPWVDGGVSSGETKVMHVAGNLRKLAREELPRWRIQQQMGRVARFCPGVFILADRKPLEERPEMASPDIVRLPLTELVMHCTSFPDIHIHDLVFTPREQPKFGAIDKAISDLTTYGLIKKHDDGRITLTDDGKMVAPLPLSFRAAAAFCEAARLGKVAEMLPLIAMLDIGDIRQLFRLPLQGANWTTSDPVFQVKVLVQQLYAEGNSLGYHERRDIAEFNNISLKKVQEYDLLLRDLEKKAQIRSHFSPYLHSNDLGINRAFDRLTKQVIFRSMMLECYPYAGLMFGVRIPVTQQEGIPYTTAKLSNTTHCETGFGDRPVMCAGTVRIVTPKRGFPFAVLENITSFSKDDLPWLVEQFGKPALQRIADISPVPTDLGLWLGMGRQEPVFGGYDSSESYGYGGRRFAPRGFASSMSARDNYREETQPKEDPQPKMGSLGDLLSEALKNKK